jgi:hypothetical protein
MEEIDNQRAIELVKKLHDAEGVFSFALQKDLFIVSYPKEEVGKLSGFRKKDLETAIELKLLG